MGANIFSLDYRLAPENKFPSSLQDANFALEWLGKELNICLSAKLVFVATVLEGTFVHPSQHYRAINNLELPLSQCLIYPMTDPSCNSKSQVDFDSGFFLSQKAMIWFWEQLMDSRDNLNDPVFNLTIDPKAHSSKNFNNYSGF